MNNGIGWNCRSNSEQELRWSAARCGTVIGRGDALPRRGTQGSRDYIALHRIDEKPDAFTWMEKNYNPRRRLLPMDVADSNAVNRALATLKPAGFKPKQQWIGEPAAGCFVAVQCVDPAPDEMPQDPADPPFEGKSIIYVHGNSGTHRAEVSGLFPGEPTHIGPRGFSPADGLPVVWSDSALFIGAPGRARGRGHGGLWRSTDGGRSWEREEGLATIPLVSFSMAGGISA